MTCRPLLIALTFGLLASVVSLAQDPDKPDEPLRLKKKKKPDEPMKEPAKPEENKKPDPMEQAKEPPIVDPVTTEEQEKELFERVGRNMRKVEDQLLNKELNEATLQLEDDILKDLDSLIKKAENDSNGGGGGGADNNPNMGEQGNDQQPQGGGMSKQQGGSRSKSQAGKQKGQQGKNQPGQGTAGKDKGPQGGMNPGGMTQAGMNPQGMNPGATSNPMGMGNTTDPNHPPDRIADLYKDVWGHLPETVRAQMNAYAGKEEYMQKHRDLIKQYYRALAEQGQKNK